MRRQLIWALVLAVAAVGNAYAQGVQTAELNGVVKSSDGQPLPGATVTVKSAALLGVRTTPTDAFGGYIFRGLPPGSYTVSYEMPGMATQERKAQILVGNTLRLEVTLSVAAVSETISVTAEAPSPLSTAEGATSYTGSRIDELPTGRTPALIAALAPGLTDNTPNGAQVTVSGAFAYDNVFLIDGVDVDDNLFGSPQDLFIEDAVDQTQVLTSGISAEYGRFSGGVINVVTKRGGNSFSGSFRTDFTNDKWVKNTLFEEAQGHKRTNKLNKIYQATLGGPIVKDRLWFFVAGRIRPTDSVAQTFPDTGIATEDHVENKRLEAKLTGAITPNHNVSVAFTNNNTTLSEPPFGYASAGLRDIDPRTIQNGSEPNNQFVATYNGVVNSKLFAEAQFSRRHFKFDGLGGTGNSLADDSPFFTSGVTAAPAGLYNATYFDATDPENRNNRQISGALSYFLSTEKLGRHDLKLGFENFRSQRTGGNSQSPTNYVFYDDYVIGADGKPALDANGRIQPDWVPGVSARGQYIARRNAILNVTTNSFYLNDKWQITGRLSANLGARYERVRSEATGGLIGVDTNTFVPRLALSLDPRGDGKFRLDGTYAHYAGKYNEVQIGANNNVGNPNFLYGVYVGPPGQGIGFAPGFDPANYATVFGSFPTANISFTPGLSSPVTKEFTLSAGSQLGPKGFVKLLYVNRKTTGVIEDFITRDLGTTKIVQNGFDVGTFDNIRYANSNGPKRKYDALQLESTYRFTHNWDATLYYTVQLHNDGTYEGEARNQPAITSLFGNYPEIYVPERNFPDGHLSAFQRSRVRAWTNYNLELGKAGVLGISPEIRFDSPQYYSLIASSVPISAIQAARDPGYANIPTTQNLYFGGRGSQSFGKNIAQFDLALQYQVPIYKSMKPYVKFVMTNVFNNQTLRSFNTTVTPDPNSPLDANGLPTNFIKGAKFGQATGTGNFPGTPGDGVTYRARAFTIAAGFHF